MLGVSPAFFRTLHIDLLEGRDFRSADAGTASGQRESAPSPASASSMSRLRSGTSGGRNPVGERVLVRQEKDVDVPLDIVGLVSDTAHRTVRERMRPIVFVPYSGDMGKARCWSAWPESRRPSARRSHGPFVASGAGARLREMRPARDFIDTQMVVERLLARLTGSFATLALLLAGIGLYGVVNDAVIQRRREIGLRMALGAQATDIVRHVTIGSLVLVSVGLIAGVGAGVAFGRLIGALLFQVTPTDPVALASPLAILATVFAMASLPPAIRAIRTDPTETLKTGVAPAQPRDATMAIVPSRPSLHRRAPR